jgi:hypothetical protein
MNATLQQNEKLQKIASQNAIKLLDSLDAVYKVTFQDGTVVVGGKHAKRQSTYPHGSLTKHFEPFVKDMEVGDVASIPTGEYEVESIRSALSGWTHRMWGQGAATSTVNHASKTVEVLRLA